MNNTIIKGIEILKLIAQSKKALNITEITKITNIPKTTVHNLVKTFEQTGFLELENKQLKSYKLGILSFEIGMKKLGGDAFVLKQDEIILGQRESIEDSSNVISRYCDLIMIRTFAHSDVEDFAKYSKVPVINALTDLSHPCQVMADLFTMKEHFGKLKGLTLTYIGDGNNVCNSLLTGCTSLGVNIKVGVPKGYEPDAKTTEIAKKIAKETGCSVDIINDVKEAVSGADVVYTDVWASMGQESEKEKRLNIFKGFTLTKELFDLANKGAIALHCLPAHKGEEISEEVFNMNSKYIYEEAENRMHAQMAIMSSIVKE